MGCDGRCCAIFRVPYSPAELRARPQVTDGEFIADMLIPLSGAAARSRAVRFGLPPLVGRSYTCRHWDTETRLCTVYDRRPQMCRDYPYNRECDHGCGYRLPQARVAALPPNRTDPCR